MWVSYIITALLQLEFLKAVSLQTFTLMYNIVFPVNLNLDVSALIKLVIQLSLKVLVDVSVKAVVAVSAYTFNIYI